MDARDIQVILNPEIEPDQLWDFYVRNDICLIDNFENGYKACIV